MLKKTSVEVYNDGVLYICDPDTRRTDFNAKVTAKSASELTERYKLNFAEKARREEDFDFAEARDRKLSLKVKCLLREDVTTADQVRIGNIVYSIIKADPSRREKAMYLYLEEARKL